MQKLCAFPTLIYGAVIILNTVALCAQPQQLPQLDWPVIAPRITQDYACKDCYQKDPGFHSGIDITDATIDSCTGNPLVRSAANDGTVVRVQKGCPNNSNRCAGGFGNHVIVRHQNPFDSDDPFYLVYAHLKEVRVSYLQSEINKSDEIGIMGSSSASDCHLHFDVLIFDPGSHGNFDKDSGSEIERMGYFAYPNSTYPSVDCNGLGGKCLDPKDFMPQLTLGAAGDIDVTEKPIASSTTIANVVGGQEFVSIARYDDGQSSWSYIALPSNTGPISHPSTNQSNYGWVPEIAYTPIIGFPIKVDGEALDGVGLSVRDSVQNGSALTKVWGGQRYWVTETVLPNSKCTEPWYKISIPPSRASDGVSTQGWICGEFSGSEAGQCIAPSLVEGIPQLQALSCGEAPTVSTNSADNITQASVRLNLSVNPNGLGTDGWFKWEKNDSTPDLNETPHFDVGSGTVNQTVNQTVGNLECDTTYYFKAYAENSKGERVGSVNSFRTDPCGSGSTTEQVLIQNGNFEQNGLFWVRAGAFYADDRFSSYNNSPGYAYLSLADGTPGNGLSGTLYQPFTIPPHAIEASLTFWVSISTQESGSTAYDVLNATLQNASGQFLATIEVLSNVDAGGYRKIGPFNLLPYAGQGVRLNFLATTDGSLPTVFRIDDVEATALVPVVDRPDVITDVATNITAGRATLNARVTPNGAETQYWFDFEPNDPTPDNDTIHVVIGDANNVESVSLSMVDLLCDTTYYFEANASNSQGSANGMIRSFRTDTCPTDPPYADTDPATNITQTAATLNADIIPNGLATTAWFTWGSTIALGNETNHQSVGIGYDAVDFTVSLGNLSCNTLYYFKAVAQNGLGTDEGALYSFRTLPCEPEGDRPIAYTNPATDMAQTSATINCDIDPNNLPTEGWFRWSDNLDNLAIVTTRQDVGSGDAMVPISEPLSGLSCGTEHFYRCYAENSIAQDVGALKTFFTNDCDQPPLLDTPTNLVVTVGSVPSANLSWTDNSNGEDGFRAQRTNSDDSFNQYALGPNTTSWIDSAVLPGETYCYRVQAFLASGESSPFSNEVCVFIPEGTTIFSDGFENGMSQWIVFPPSSVSNFSIDLEADLRQYLSIDDVEQTHLDGPELTDFTFELWFKPESLSTQTTKFMCLVSKGIGGIDGDESYWMMLQAGDDRLRMELSGNGKRGIPGYFTDFITDPFLTAPDLSKWIHLAVTYDLASDTFTVYRNTVSISAPLSTPSYGLDTTIFNSVEDFLIGALNGGSGFMNYFDGKLDEVRIWDRVRTAQEITDNYQRELSGNEPGLLAYWKFNGNTTDSSSNENDLNTVGGPVYSNDVPF